MARTIVREVRINVAPAGSLALATQHPANPEAHEAYLVGLYYWNKRTPEGNRKSVEYFRRAVGKDPGYAGAYAALADSLIYFSSDQARLAAMRALELDPTIAEAHTALAGVMLFNDWDWAGADRELKQALELNSNYPTAHHWRGLFLASMGRLDQAIEELRQAEALDPLSLVIRSALADELSCAGRTDEALNIIRQVLTMDPNFPKGRLVLGSIYARSRRYAEAISAFEKAQEIGGEPIELLGWTSYVYTLTGNRAAAESAVRRIQELYALHHEPAPASVKASMYLGLGDNDRAFRWLQRACKGHDDALNYLKTAPEFDPLRADPRFKDLLRCVGLPT